MIDGYFIRSFVATVLLLGSAIASILTGVYLAGLIGLGLLVLTALVLFAYFYNWTERCTALLRPVKKAAGAGKAVVHEEKPSRAEV